MDSQANAKHECAQMPKTGVSVWSGAAYFEADDLGWCLIIERVATEDDLQRNQYLEEIGDPIWTTAVEISCCPYCGEELTHTRSKKPPDDFGYFVHMDFSGWLSRRT